MSMRSWTAVFCFFVAVPAWSASAEDETVTLACEARDTERSLLGFETAVRLGARILGWGIEHYAEQFKANYSAAVVQDEFPQTGLDCQFERSVDGEPKLSFRFSLVPSIEKSACRVTVEGLEYIGAKAKRGWLPLAGRDRIELGMSVTLRSVGIHEVSGPQVWDSSAGFSLRTKSFPVSGREALQPAVSDWIPMPQGGAYSVSVRVVESGKLESDLRKLARKLRAAGR